jgi:sn-glycerol 3-phosphate transport system ATP-binding protein
MATLTLSNICKSFQAGSRAVDSVSIEVDDGEFLALLGPSGCGKSTLLRMIAGLEVQDSGSIALDQDVLDGVPPAKRDVAMVFQNYALYPHMTVFGNMAYALKNRKVAKESIRKRVLEAAELLRLTEYLDRKPMQLSGGQRQRVAMGRALVREPRIFLFDEPLSNLDASLRATMRLEIRQLQRRLGITSVFVTHDQIEAMTMADRLVVMNQGRIEQIGTPLDVYRDPQTSFVAGFIGSPAINRLVPELIPDLPSQCTEVCIRPEHLRETGEVKLGSFTIELIEELGSETILYGALSGGNPLAIRIEGVHAKVMGETLTVCCDSKDLLLFDHTGARVVTTSS